MVGLAEIALNTAPIFGGALLAVSAGQFKRPDYRAIIKQDMDLLDRLPPDATERRADLQRTIDSRIDDLVNISQRNRAASGCRVLPWQLARSGAPAVCGALHLRLVGR